MKIISLGVGVQSTALYLMSSTGLLPRADAAIFADPGAESVETYKYLEWLKRWKLENRGIKIIHSKRKNSILRDLLNKVNSTGQRFAVIPAFTKNDNGKIGMLRRQCTYEYKIKVVDKEIRFIHGLKKFQRNLKTDVWIGITLDEINRMKDSPQKWKTNIYPFLDKNYLNEFYTRANVRSWFQSNGFPIPPKSACIFCPFQSNRMLARKKNNPNEWNVIKKVDEAIRESSKKNIKQKVYLHRTCLPIDEVSLNENQLEIFDNDCSGYCGL